MNRDNPSECSDGKHEESRRDGVRQESLGGMDDLSRKRVEETQRLKRGERSGVSGLLGKPVLCDESCGVTTRDTFGRVDSITYPKGESNKFEYDTQGKLTKVTSSDHTSWRREEGLWFKYDKDGDRVDNFSGDMYVTKYGELVQKDGDRYVKVIHRNGDVEATRKNGDGTTTVTNPDGSQVETEPPGRVTRVIYPGGKWSDFEYDENHKLKGVKSSDDTTWERQDGVWLKYDKERKPIDDVGAITVEKNGDVVERAGDFKIKTTRRNGDVEIVENYPSKTKQIVHPDGSGITTDKPGHVLEVKYPGGKKNEFEYEGDKLVKVKSSDDTTWEREGNDWFKYDKSHERIDHLGGEITVDKNGDMVEMDGDFRSKTTYHNGDVETVENYPSKTREITHPDGSGLITDESHRVLKVKYAGGAWNNFEYDENGQLVTVTSSKGAFCIRDEGVWLKSEKVQGEDKVTHFDGQIMVDKKGNIVTTGTDKASGDEFLKTIKPDHPETSG